MKSPMGSMLNKCFRNEYKGFDLVNVDGKWYYFTAEHRYTGNTHECRFDGTTLFVKVGAKWVEYGTIERYHQMLGVRKRATM